jgi:hypothetical protein
MAGNGLLTPVCKVLKDHHIDSGTMCLQHSPVPGSLGKRHTPSPAEIAAKKQEYLRHAREVSYLMQAKSEADGARNWVGRQIDKLGRSSKPGRVQSFLGGAFLRMYLDHKKDPDIIAAAGEEIGASVEFTRLMDGLNRYLQVAVDARRVKAEPSKLRDLADQHLKAIKKSQGIAFRTTLNAVIGGVTGVAVKSVVLLGDTPSPRGILSRYRIEVTFSDTYDFANKRSGEYERYRKQLAAYLLANDFDKFEAAYWGEVKPFARHKTKLDNAAVFAAFMYALEMKKWTHGGLDWEVTVPGEITILHASNAADQKTPVHKPLHSHQ